ncbi:MAG: UDP-galactopyranose mutase [Clostridiales Family XIII bacterium]|jgi:UDP-galactopyranose mutase|nr:UDP-galactopyranose mutase [Clostridiales Family XIII bacterium]
MMMYDYLIVGAGLFGAVFAHEMRAREKRCLVIDRRSHIGGNCHTKRVADIDVHSYGAHIFHTDDGPVWDYVNRFAEFNRYTNSPIANYKGEIYNLPFNMNTFHALWGVRTPREAKEKIESQRLYTAEPQNLEEQALSLVGGDIYEKLIKGYTEKQWGRKCSELPAFIIKRLPLRFTYDNNYFNDRFQGVPIGGYTPIFEKLLAGCELRLNTPFDREKHEKAAKRIVYTGAIDEYFDFCLGALEYRSLRFESETLDTENHQGNAVVNYTSADVPYTRIIEHKHFAFGTQPVTVISREYPRERKAGDEPYYPVNDARNNALYARYRALADREANVLFGGRLGLYRYFDMWRVIKDALACAEREIG